MKCPKSGCGFENPPEAIYCGECGTKLKENIGFVETNPEAGMANNSTRVRSSKGGVTLKTGEVFAGRYEILSVVGEGGMGVVYRAKDQRLGKEVALKLVRADRLAGQGQDAVDRMVREGLISRDIRHPNVVAVYDVDVVDEQPYLTMEYLSGKSLHTWLRERVLTGQDCSMQTASRIIEEILQGLDVAHKAGVVHRDLKPENIMLLSDPDDREAKLKILDFGVARAAGSGDTGSTGVGTPHYMAPEQQRTPDGARPSADLYSLSVIFYELLVGARPQGHWQPPSRGRNDVPPGIDQLIEAGLSNKASARPQSVAQYAQALAQAQHAGGFVGNNDWQKWLRGLGNTGEFQSAWEQFKKFGMSGGLLGQLGQNNQGGQSGGQGGTGRGGLAGLGGFENHMRNLGGQLSKKNQGGGQVPAPGRLNLWGWFLYGVTKRYADGRGRAHRKEFWGFSLGALATIFTAMIVDAGAFADEITYGGMLPPLTIFSYIALIIPSIAVTSRRLHDIGMSGWLAMITIIPLIGLVVGLSRGTPGENAYGPDPLAAETAAAGIQGG